MTAAPRIRVEVVDGVDHPVGQQEERGLGAAGQEHGDAAAGDEPVHRAGGNPLPCAGRRQDAWADDGA